jgi:hypothetical protein
MEPFTRLLKRERTAQSHGRRTREYAEYFEYDAPPSYADGVRVGGMGPRRVGAMSLLSFPR